MAENDIDEVPLLYFYKNGVHILFENEMNKENLRSFLV